MHGESLDIKQDRLQRLKDLFPELFTESQVDWEKLKAAFGDDINFANERYVLNWAGKSDAFRVLQQPTTATLKPIPKESYLTPSPSPEGEGSWNDFTNSTTQNLFIEGENLEVLKVLQKAYYGKVKCIIIDPPYNTGSDSFIYPDKFSEKKEDYLKRIGDKDEEGYLMKEGLFRKNSKDSGHYHSNWLSMMYPRLFLAKNLLRDDGVIFVHIDDNEVHNLRLVMNEIFGEENFRNAITIKRGVKSVQMQFDTVDKLGSGYETVLMYTKNASYRFPRIEKTLNEKKGGTWNNHWRGTDRPTMRYELFGITPKTGQWRWSKERSLKAIENYNSLIKELSKNESEIVQDEVDNWYTNKINEHGEDIDLLRISKNGKPEHYIPPSETTLANDVWFDLPPNSTRILKSLFGFKIFDNPKPIELVKRIMDFFASNNDIILDFFAGSGTTAQAVLELNKEDGGNRKFILVQMPEPCDENSEASKAGYKTIADIGKERIRRVIKRLTPGPSPEGEGSRENYTANLFKGATPTLFENAGNLRKVQTEAEEKLWQALRNRAFADYKFRRQHPIGKYIADFYCHEKKLVIEVDGGYHNEKEQQELDEQRTQVINDFGIQVIRLKNEEVLNDLPQALEIIRHLTPNPSPSGEGRRGEVGFKVFKLSPSNFKIWRGSEIDSEEKLTAQLDAFTNPVRPGAEKQNMLYELMLKAGYELTSPLRPSPEGEGRRGEVVYSINNNELIIALDAMNEKLVEQIIAAKPQKVITLDSLFTGNDQLKTNTVLQMRDAGVDFKTI